MKERGHSIILGGIGGDGHSVGLHLLRWVLTDRGYGVHFLGVRNTMEDFLRYAFEFNAVMISNMDGHAQHYLSDISHLPVSDDSGMPLWYLGGNLTIGEPEGFKEYFENLGFRRAYVKFVDIETVLKDLENDLIGMERVQPRVPMVFFSEISAGVHRSSAGDKRLPHVSFVEQRKEVLSSWPTGREARFMADNAEFLRGRPNFPSLLRQVARGESDPVIQPRCGVVDVAGQLELFHLLRRHGASALSYQVDSLSRANDYVGAAREMARHADTGRSMLNGFPVVNHGVAALRRIIEEMDTPIQTRHSTKDPRLLADISYAGGVSAFEGGAICYNIPYFRDYDLRHSIESWKYVDRLTGIYLEEYGIVLDREFFGTLTATLIPPCIALTTNIVEALLASRQGVKCVSLAYAEQGNRAQDIAAIRTMASLAREVLDHHGFSDVEIYTVFHQYMAAFPPSEARARELIFESAVTAGLSGATRLIAKSPVESRRIPSCEANLQGLYLAGTGLEEAKCRQSPDEKVLEESKMLRVEVESILDAILSCGRGDVEVGIVEAFKNGIIDIPFAPSIFNAGKVSTIRDTDGAVRFLSLGNLPFDGNTREFHRQKVEDRRMAFGAHDANDDWRRVISDVLQVPREQYTQWPLDSGAEASGGSLRKRKKKVHSVLAP